MTTHVHRMPSAPSVAGAQAVAPYVCQSGSGLWAAIEQALDNGDGELFVTDDAGRFLRQLNLTDLRAAVRSGAYRTQLRLGDIAAQAETGRPAPAVTPLLDDARRVVGVRRHAGAAFVPVAEPDLTHAELRHVLDAFLSTWISSSGDYIGRFEQAFATRMGSSHGVATSNGTVSLQLALAALGIGPGDEVIVPDLTFAASANTVIHAGATPVIIDVDPDSWCVTPEAIARAITPRTRAVMPVHVFGRPAPMREIRDLALRHGLYVIEDAAEAHGAGYDGAPVGSYSDIASFSFFANKIITTGEGGICLTQNADLAARLRMLRDHGMRPERKYWHEEVGFNFRMTNIQAAIGCAQLERMDELLAMRRAAHALYEAALGDIPGVTLPPPMPERCQPVTWFSCVLAPPEHRAALIQGCRDIGVDLRPFFNGLSAMPAYRRYARNCPASAALSASGLNLPTSRKTDAAMVDRIAGVFRRVLSPGLHRAAE